MSADWMRGVIVKFDDVAAVSEPSTITSIEDRWGGGRDKYTAEDWRAMSAALGESKMLRKLKLRNLTKDAADALFCADDRDWPVLEVLDLFGGKFRIAGLQKIIPLLHHLSTLKTLNLGGTGMGVMTARSLKEALDRTRIHILDVSWNNIKDEGLEVILSSQHAKHLVKLHVDGCKFTTRGFETLAQFIRRDDIELKLLAVDIESKRGRRSDLVSESDATRWRQMLAEAIPKSSTLEAITLSKSYGLRAELYDTLLNLVCDTLNLEALISSNHRLCSLDLTDSRDAFYLSFRTKSHPALTKAFEINLEAHRRAEKEAGADRSGIIANAIRRKVRNLYLAKKDFDLQGFNDMDVLLMPRLIHLVLFKEPDEDDRRIYWQPSDGQPLIPREDLNSIYRLLRNCHVAEVFSFKSPEQQLSEKDETIQELEDENGELKTANESLKEENASLKAKEKSMKQKLEELERENEELRGAGSGRPNKRAKTDDVESQLAALKAGQAASESRHAASESRFVALEAEIAMLKAR